MGGEGKPSVSLKLCTHAFLKSRERQSVLFHLPSATFPPPTPTLREKKEQSGIWFDPFSASDSYLNGWMDRGPSAGPFIRPVGGTGQKKRGGGKKRRGRGAWNGDGPYPPRTEKKALL